MILFLAFLLWLMESLKSYTDGSRWDGSTQDMNSPLIKWVTGDHFGVPARQVHTNAIRLGTKWRDKYPWILSEIKRTLALWTSRCAEIRRTALKPFPFLSCWYRTILSISALNKWHRLCFLLSFFSSVLQEKWDRINHCQHQGQELLQLLHVLGNPELSKNPIWNNSVLRR